MNVCFKFYGLGYDNYYQACVYIYDSFNNLVYSGQTYNGKLEVCLKANARYKVVATFFGEVLVRYICGNLCSYIFIFNHAILQNQSITFILTDYFYNLPIGRGELLLWQS